jgi:hypothetical protein
MDSVGSIYSPRSGGCFFQNMYCFGKVLLLIFITLFFASSPALAGKKKLKGRMIGPTGIIGVCQPSWPKIATEIIVTHIEKGSPASRGALKAGDLIVGFGNEKFKRHPFWDMVDAIEQAEGSDGALPLLMKDGKQVKIKLSPIGSYSATAPYNCSKTDKIIKETAELLIKSKESGRATQTVILGLMATGEKKYLDVVGEKIHSGGLLDIDPKAVEAYLKGGSSEFGSTGWTWGYDLLALGEYYLLTKDEKVLSAIRTKALGLAKGQDGLGLYGHRVARGPKRRAPGYGVMNQPSISNLMGMLIAQKCGINDPVLDKAIEKTYAYVSDVAWRGGFTYGSGGAWAEHWNNNGTSGSAAICMSLKGNQEGARFFSQAAATSYDSLTSGHASSFFNPLWTPLGASLSGPEVTQQFFKRALWYFNGERDWKGGFPQISSAGAVAGQALLTYCLPRKALLITGREADSSIHVKGDEVNKVILRSKFDYGKASTEDLIEMLKDPFVQVRMKVKKELSRRTGRGTKINSGLMKKILAMMEGGGEQIKVDVISYLGGCHADVLNKYVEFLGQMVRNEKQTLKVRVAAASALGSKVLGAASVPYVKDILELVLEKPTEPDPFRKIENTLSKALSSIMKYSGTKPMDKESMVEKKLVYEVSNRFLSHKRQNVRQVGCALIEGLPEEDFPIIAERLMLVLKNEDPTYHSYSQAINVPGITILADFNIKEGLDFLEHAIFHGGGKWAFKYKSLMNALPKYGANAAPYIEKYEAHKSINKPGDRFTPSWQKMVKKIREDKSPKKMKTFDEVMAGVKNR